MGEQKEKPLNEVLNIANRSKSGVSEITKEEREEDGEGEEVTEKMAFLVPSPFKRETIPKLNGKREVRAPNFPVFNAAREKSSACRKKK